MQTLFLGSKSMARRMLLEQAHIPFKIVDQNIDETFCDWTLPLDQLVQLIAKEKMKHLVLPQGKQGEKIFVLTADTLSQTQDTAKNKITLGKPENYADAIAKIRLGNKGPMHTATAFCLERRVYEKNGWVTQEQIMQVVQASHEFHVPEDMIEIYLKTTHALQCAGAIAIEGYGNQFLKWVNGSYSTIVGLPMFQLHQALKKIGFFS